MKLAITVTLKKDVLDPQGKTVQQTLKNLGVNSIQKLRQGKYFEVEIIENDENNAMKIGEDICKKLLANLIIEDYKINILK